MGGNALKTAPTRRLTKDEFEQTSALVSGKLQEELPPVVVDFLDALQAALPSARIAVIPAYFSKTDFGDIDVLVEQEAITAYGGFDAIIALAQEAFNATEFYKNGSVLSFDFRSKPDQTEAGFQVDIVGMPAVDFEFASRYYAFSDLGNLVGRVAHKMGLTFGHDGLTYSFRDGDYMFRKIHITRDVDAALTFLGFDAKKHREGFDTLDEIFQYVISSAYFNKAIYLLENRSYRARTRDRKRKTYMEFLQLISATEGLVEFTYPENKKDWLPRIFEAFPAFKPAYDQTVLDHQRSQLVRVRFNGDIVSSLTGLTGKKLGMLMSNIRDEFATYAAFQQFVLDTPDENFVKMIFGVRAKLSPMLDADNTPAHNK